MYKDIVLEGKDYIANLGIDYEIEEERIDTDRGTKVERYISIKSIEGTIEYFDDDEKSVSLNEITETNISDKMYEQAADVLRSGEVWL